MSLALPMNVGVPVFDRKGFRASVPTEATVEPLCSMADSRVGLVPGELLIACVPIAPFPRPLWHATLTPMRPHDLGRRGEEAAARHLEERGWRILDRNVHLGHKEIDLIVRRNGVIAFVEVKTRAGRGYGHPLEAITRKKRREIERVAAAWLKRARARAAILRFDAVSVLVEGAGPLRIEHVENAWRLGD